MPNTRTLIPLFSPFATMSTHLHIHTHMRRCISRPASTLPFHKHIRPTRLPFITQTPRRSITTTTPTPYRSTEDKTPTANPPSTPPEESARDHIEAILENNRSWAQYTYSNDPELFPTLSKGQSPKILWIGCCDSRVPETTILGLKPGDVFVHRNIANIVSPTDLNSLSAIEYAVVYLKVERIYLCGHTSCGGVVGALANKKLGKIDTWLVPLRQLRLRHAKELESLDDAAKAKKLVELNVAHGVEMLRQNPDVLEAIEERGLTVHGLVYSLESGQLYAVDVDEETHVHELRKEAFEVVA